MSAPVQRDQFQISLEGITHMPTGTTYTPHPGAPYCGTLDFKGLEKVLPNGDDYRRYEVQEMMRLLWEEYVTANPRLFEVHD